MKQSMDVIIIKSLVKNENIKTLLIDYCFKKYCKVSTDNTNVYIESRQSIGEFSNGRQYLINLSYHESSVHNLYITVSTVEHKLVARTVLCNPNIFLLESIINTLIKEYLIRELNSINYQLSILGGDY